MNMKNLPAIVKKSLIYILVAALSSGVTWFVADKTPNSKLEELADVIDKKFIAQADQTEIQDAAANAMVEALGDQWSYYIPASQQEFYQERKNNAYVGIGVSVMEREDKTGYDVVGVVSGGPAEEAGILPGDVITHADGVFLGDLPISEGQNYIIGEKNTKVVLTLLRGEETLEISVARRAVHPKVAEGVMLDDQIGYVRIENFYEGSANDTIAAIEELTGSGAEKLIFDVRSNPGGYISELIELLDYLLPEGALLRSVDYAGKEEVQMSDENCLKLPMVVMINAYSYSSAEFFAAALAEYDWAVTVGEATTGKGYYQSTYVFSDGSSVSLSSGKYTTPNGVSLAEVGGLVPDVEVALPENISTWQEDPQLQAAMAALAEETK